MWKSIRKEKPDEHEHVLVARDHFGDEALSYFIASYWEVEDEWSVFITMATPKKSTYLRVTIPAQKDDIWMHIPNASDDS